MNAASRPLLIALALAAAGCGPAESPPDLAIRISPQCTTCDDFVRCRSEPALGAGAAAEAIVVYHLTPRSAGAQIATIIDYATQLFRRKTSDERPLIVYRERRTPAGLRERDVVTDERATLDLVAYRLEVPGAWIDQRTGEWHGAGGEPLGRCESLSRADGMAFRDGFAASLPGGGAL